MNVQRTCAGIVALVLAAPVVASEPRWFSTRADPAFADARSQLQRLVDADARHPANSFCVVGERIDGDRHAYVHWLTENRLILWEPQVGNPRAIVGSRRNLDLKRDVVLGDDVGGSTYRVTRAWATRVLAACRRIGTHYLIHGRSIRRG